MDDPFGPLRNSVDRLHRLVRGLDDTQLEGPSYCRDWTIAAVLSHLGSGAVLTQRRLHDARTGTTMPDEAAQSVWDEWNAKTPRAQADDCLVEDERLLAALDAVPVAERARLEFSFGPVSLGFDEAVAARLNEHALHTWDIAVMLDAAARIPPDATSVLVDNLGLIARFTATPTGDEREVRVRTSDPVRHFTVRLTPAAAELLEGDAGLAPDLELPAESFCRLVYGRLDPDHSPPVGANGELLDVVRRVFPGP
jgi:uncharacterized protein (TIGR03083 family)